MLATLLRGRQSNTPKRQKLQGELQSDPKEIVEYILSVKEVVEELSNICSTGTVVIEDLMSVRVCSNIQHLGPRVVGYLSPDKDS